MFHRLIASERRSFPFEIVCLSVFNKLCFILFTCHLFLWKFAFYRYHWLASYHRRIIYDAMFLSLLKRQRSSDNLLRFTRNRANLLSLNFKDLQRSAYDVFVINYLSRTISSTSETRMSRVKYILKR